MERSWRSEERDASWRFIGVRFKKVGTGGKRGIASSLCRHGTSFLLLVLVPFLFFGRIDGS